MKSTFKILSLLALFTFAIPSNGISKEKKTEAPKTKEKKTEAVKIKDKFTALYAQVEAITDTLLTIKGDGGDTKFVINVETKITKDKEHKEVAKASDVKVGQWVGGSYTKSTEGNVLHSLHLGVNQEGKGAVKKPKS